MKQYLEQRMYEFFKEPEEKQRVYQVGDLEYLSATALYTDKLPLLGPEKLPSFGNPDPLGFSKSIKIPEVNVESIHKDFFGNSWSKSFEPTNLYIKETLKGTLHVHHTKDGLITGANLENNGKKEPISNYMASILDLFPGKTIKKKEFWEW